MSEDSRSCFAVRLALCVAVLALVSGFCGAAWAADTLLRSNGSILQMCTGKYALCDAAACTPIAEQKSFPGSPVVKPSHALCSCVVEEGKNLGPGPCSDRTPTGPKGEYILSTYSYALKSSYLTCPKGGTRTVCFGYPCIIDAKDPKRAHCTCPIIYDSEEFKTQGGNCNPSSCKNGLWQGGTPAEYEVINAIFTKDTGQKPPKDCPAKK
ncbi:MAG TPA: hypothetical protein VF173_01265 [Thermoanaerobaculia bacterium]|nr:hypothetical protein [Thermoanaerobaculia bacterium]